jgi:hypothetical protein
MTILIGVVHVLDRDEVSLATALAHEPVLLDAASIQWYGIRNTTSILRQTLFGHHIKITILKDFCLNYHFSRTPETYPRVCYG